MAPIAISFAQKRRGEHSSLANFLLNRFDVGVFCVDQRFEIVDVNRLPVNDSAAAGKTARDREPESQGLESNRIWQLSDDDRRRRER